MRSGSPGAESGPPSTGSPPLKSNPKPQNPATRTEEDGSMDTILASIRRILNEDEVAPAEAAPARPEIKPAEPTGSKDDVLVLREAMMVPPEKPEPTPTPPAPQPAPDARAIEGLVAARTRAAASQSFDALQDALRRDQPPAAPTSPAILRAGGPTLEDMVREELRGLLSNWLDVHLPGLVETLVRSEIEKLTRR